MDICYLDQPWEVAVETLALCNAACHFCPYPTLERKGARLPDDALNRILFEMSGFKHPFVFSPFKVNEPLIEPRIQEICTNFMAICPPWSRLRLFTNGTALTLPTSNWIGTLPPDRVMHLWISLNSMNAQDHQKQMHFAAPQWEKISRNLDRIHELMRLGKFPHRVIVSRVVAGDEHDVGFMRRATHRWPRFTPFLIKKDTWLFDIAAPQRKIPNSTCARWWELSIDANGVAALCCMDGRSKYAIGNVHEHTLAEIYNAAPFRALRASVIDRRNAAAPCNTCTY